MSDIAIKEVAAVSSEDQKKKNDQLLAGLVWGAAAFSLGLAIVVMVMMDEGVSPLESIIDWLAA